MPQAHNPWAQGFTNLATALWGDPQAAGQMAFQQARTRLTEQQIADLASAARARSRLGALFESLPGLEAAVRAPVQDPGVGGAGRIMAAEAAAADRDRARRQLELAPARMASIGSEFVSDPADLAQLFLFLTANSGQGDDATIRALAGTGSPIGVNQAVSLGGQDRVRAANAANALEQALAVQALSDAGAMDRLLAQPIETSAGATTVVPNVPGRREGGVIEGRDTFSTSRGALANRAAAGEQLTPLQAAILGVDQDDLVAGSGGENRPSIDFSDTVKIDEEINAVLGLSFDKAGNLTSENVENLDPTLRAAVRDRAIDLFRDPSSPSFRNPTQAVRSAIDELVEQGTRTEEGWFFDTNIRTFKPRNQPPPAGGGRNQQYEEGDTIIQNGNVFRVINGRPVYQGPAS